MELIAGLLMGMVIGIVCYHVYLVKTDKLY